MPRYSIIVPIYNANQWLLEALASVQNQTCGDWECICINDGSNDDSAVIIDKFARNDSRFKQINGKHEGVGPARNKGISASTGEYLLFLDADDWLDVNALERLESESADIVSFLPEKDAGLFDSMAGNLIAWNGIYKRLCVNDIAFPNLVNCEDLVYAAEAYAHAKTIKAGVKPWYHHRATPGSAYNSHSWRRVRDSWKSIGMMYKYYHPIATDFRMRTILWRKLVAHFILHVVAEIPRVIMKNH